MAQTGTSNIGKWERICLVLVCFLSLFSLSAAKAATLSGGTRESTIVRNYVGALKAMTRELNAVAMHHTAMMASFFDAKQQLETQEELARLKAEAHKDYQPGEQMCHFGTFIRSIAKTEEKAAFDKIAFNKTLMSVYTDKENSISAEGYESDIASRLSQFKKVYCDPQDNNGGLSVMCKQSGGNIGAEDPERINKDIDFNRSIDSKLTLDINAADETATADETDVYALARNLYWNRALLTITPETVRKYPASYNNARALIATQNVAHSTLANIMALKSGAAPDAANQKGAGQFIKALMRDFQISDEEINKLLGDNPSYHAQMEVLTKKIYQSPSFYTNLYDKPVNVKRTGVAMEAIQLMQGRDRLESALRREMLLSLMIENELKPYVSSASANISSSMR